MNRFLFFLFLIFQDVRAQVFIPFSNFRNFTNCSSTYCPTLNPTNATLQGTGGSTQIVNTCVDDASILTTLPFDFHMGDTLFRDWHVGSNGYITAGTGSALYNSLGAAIPALPKIHLGAGDANYQAVFTRSGTNFFRIRYEGNSAYGTCTVNTIYEITFFRPTINYQFIQVVFGSHGGTARPFGIASASAYYATTTPIVANSSYVIYSYNDGNTWFLLPAYSITGTGTTL